MVPLHTVFIIMLAVFALIGSLRGWAKEIIVAFSVVLALFIEDVMTQRVIVIRDLWANIPIMSQFWIRIVIFGLIVIFGYASPSVAQRLGSRVARERLQDILLGFFIGLLNGALIIGSLWSFMEAAHYGVPEGQYIVQEIIGEDGEVETIVIYDPEAKGLGGIRPAETDHATETLLPYLPPRIINGAVLYLAVGLAFVFVIIVFI
ncbi:MAG: CvpA family protein [Anaerolineae bacterium]|nr:CvpA family protein [Anaerolineae bacterium]